MLALHVRNWDATFETAETRKLRRLTWLPLPNKQDGDGYCELLDHEDGPAHLAAWTVILQLASKSSRRGWLLRETGAGVLPHDAVSVARITRIPADVLRAAVPRLLAIGWLEEVEVPASEPAGVPGAHPGLPGASAGEAVQKGREGTGPEGTGRDEQGTACSRSASPSGVQGETAAAAYRLRLLAILNRYGATMTMKGKDLTPEWCNAVDPHPLDWIEHLFKTTRPRPHLPSQLRALLKASSEAFEAWWNERDAERSADRAVLEERT